MINESCFGIEYFRPCLDLFGIQAQTCFTDHLLTTEAPDHVVAMCGDEPMLLLSLGRQSDAKKRDVTTNVLQTNRRLEDHLLIDFVTPR